MLRISATAKSCLQAWKFLRQWQVANTKLFAYADHLIDTRAFSIWLQTYLDWLAQHNYIDFDLMVDQLIENHKSFVGVLPTKICLLGVDDLSPQYATLVQLLAENGVEFVVGSMTTTDAILDQQSFMGEEAEFTAAALWAQQQITLHPDRVVAVVVPELERKRQTVQRVFSKQLTDDVMNISAPLALADYPPIAAALLILQLVRNIIEYSDFSVLIRSPFINGAEAEANVRSLIDRALRDKVEAKIAWARLLKDNLLSGTTLVALIDKFVANLPTANIQQEAEVWVQHIQKLLACWGWPGERSLTIQEVHLQTCWLDILHEYCQLSVIYGAHTFYQTLQIIQRLANDTPFLPAETGQTKVHVLGVLEAAGILFDSLWVTGMDRESWPPDAAPNPFIPAELQRELDMPRSSPQRELNVARRLTATLKQGAKNSVTFSYPLSRDDLITSASNLIVDIPMLEYARHPAPVKQISPAALERIVDNQAPNYALTQIAGGSQLFKLQAQCPFKAYAEMRLRAKPLNVPQLILTAAQRGQIVHKVLEEFWLACKSHTQLCEWLPVTINSILQDIITKVLNAQQRMLPYTLTSNYLMLEQNRLQQLIARWLKYEVQRQPFTVRQLEQKISISFGPLTVSIKIDRVDDLANGQLVVIDYKTGSNQISDWFTQPIQEPQLPMYALSMPSGIVGVVVANLQPQFDKMQFMGIVAEDSILPDARLISDFELQLADWRTSLTQIAIDFTAGTAVVQPYSKTVCQRCQLQALCRLYDY